MLQQQGQLVGLSSLSDSSAFVKRCLADIDITELKLSLLLQRNSHSPSLCYCRSPIASSIDRCCCCHLQMHKYDDPVLTTADINKKRDVLDRVCQPIASKPAPPPPKPAEAPAAAAEQQQPQQPQQQNGSGAEPIVEEPGEGTAAPMDSDQAGAGAGTAETTPMEQ